MRTLSIRRKLLDGSAPTTGTQAPVFQITSTKLDRHRDRVLAIKADGPELVVPLLWSHASWEPALGTARCFQEGGVWLMEALFDELDERSKIVAAKVKAGTLNACSIGFIPVNGYDPVPNAEGGLDYPLVHLVEGSVVNVGANEDALRVRSMAGQQSGGDAALVAALNAVAMTQTILAKALDELTATESDEEEEAAPAPTEEKNADDEAKEEAATEEMTPKAFAAALVAHAEAGKALADAFLATESDDEDLVALAEGLRDGLPTDVEEAKAWLARAEEEDAESTDDASESEEEAEDAPLPEEEAKAMRRLVREAFGFSVAQAKALTVRDLRAYAALCPRAA
ncbi:primosomal replication protein N [Corallococcus sp. CA047B]|uniref:primosomal replication protein N n=1 Tax=Corallococcus sp. CA047B TaxID=2316729 RepID=UPI000EA13FBE|nr:primosomal replication protein N [Corallococcus sp. CA047B]RKH19139.1 primosomal replication protein N [Corallococcus sp. CA047B]